MSRLFPPERAAPGPSAGEWPAAAAPEAPEGSRSRRRGAVVLGGALAAVGLLVFLLLVASGVDGAQAGRIVLVVLVQAVTGALMWRLARGAVPAYVTELVGMGLALGTLTSLLGTQLLLPFGWGGSGWLLPTALVVVSLGLPAVRRRLRSGGTRTPTADELGGVLAGLAVGLAFVRCFWQAHPLEWTGWWQYYPDIPHHEALATSVVTWGPGDNILAAGEPIRYHWFAHGWAGAVTNASSAEPFVVVTRVLPVVALLGTVCLVWAWGRRLSETRTVPLLAVLVTTVAVNVATEKDLDFVQLFTVSPSLGLGALWLLGAALVFTEYLRDRVGRPHLLLALLAVGCVGGKTSYAAVLGGGVGLVAVVSLWTPEFRARAWRALGTVALSVAGAFVALILGSSGNLELAIGASAVTFGILPNGTALGFAIGTLGVCLILAAKWAGVAVLLADRSTAGRPEVWFGVGAAVTGLLLMAVLGHPGASQLYFPVSAGLVVGVVSAWGLGERVGRLPWGWLAVAVLAGAAVGTVGAAQVPSVPAWAIPFLVWLVPVVPATAALVLARKAPRPRVAAAVLGWGLLCASLVAGTGAVWESLRAPSPAPPGAHAISAWTESHAAALRWLRSHSDQDDVVVTNRQCSAPQLGPGECAPQRWFLTAALGQRRMYVEGADYAAGLPHPDWVDDRVERSRRFVDEPNRADAEVLWNAGVRWVVVDLASTATRDWGPFAEPAFANEVTEILRLSRP